MLLAVKGMERNVIENLVCALIVGSWDTESTIDQLLRKRATKFMV